MAQLRVVRHHVALAGSRWREPEHRSNEHLEAVAVGTIEARCRIRVGPRTIEERDQPVLKDVQKLDDGGIFGMVPPLIGELSQVDRQWAVGSKQSKRMLLEPPTLRGLFVSEDIRSCEFKVRR